MSTTESAVLTSTLWSLDPAHTLVEFSAKHMMITTVKGRIPEVSGTIVLDEREPQSPSVQVELDAASIDTGVESRDNHLRSADFLDVERYPVITFRSRQIEGSFREPGDEFRLAGDLTIHGTTRRVILKATYQGRGTDLSGDERISFSAWTEIDRRDFGLAFNQTLETGGVLVSNALRLSIEVQAVKQ